MFINDKWKKHEAAKVIEYAFYYDSDIIHVYDLEHAYAYLDKDDKLIGVKATRHGVIMTHYGKPEDIKYFKGHPILYSIPGKHNHVVSLKQVNQRLIRKSCEQHAGSDGIYHVQFFNPKIWNKIKPYDLGRKKIHEIYLKKFSFSPSYRFRRVFIPSRAIMMPWFQLMNEIPDRMINFLKNEVNKGI
jgi:putative hydrolase of the HAD superfamily